jgi:hypothetical protein
VKTAIRSDKEDIMRTSSTTQERSKFNEIFIAFNSHITGYPLAPFCALHGSQKHNGEA